MAVFFTIGHSTRSIEEFVGILQHAKIETLVDVRSVPRSRTNPQFNADRLPMSLGEHGIGYVHLVELGGLRGRQSTREASPNSFWENESFRNYADYAMSDSFRAGLQKLIRLGEATPCAIMCAEAVWWRCHRRIIADYLIFAGETVVHLLAPGKSQPANVTPAARQIQPGVLIYPQ